VGGFASNDYVSSSEFTPNVVWGQNFDDGNQLDYGKRATLGVRADRAFELFNHLTICFPAGGGAIFSSLCAKLGKDGFSANVSIEYITPCHLFVYQID
jgi:hypothetical protein